MESICAGGKLELDLNSSFSLNFLNNIVLEMINRYHLHESNINYLCKKVRILYMRVMAEPDITIVSDKGQIVIPAYLRNKLGIKPRTKLLVYNVEDTIILKKLKVPDLEKEMKELYKEIDKKIAKYGELSEEDIQKEIERYRAEKRKKA